MVRFPLLFLILLTAFGLPRGAGAQGVFDFEPDTLFYSDYRGEIVMTNVSPDTVVLDSMTMRWNDPTFPAHVWGVGAVGQPTSGNEEYYEFFQSDNTVPTDLSFLEGDTLLLSFALDPCPLCLQSKEGVIQVDTLVFHSNGLVANDTLILDWAGLIADEEGPGNQSSMNLAIWPNPSNGSVHVELSLDRPEDVSVAVYDVRGRQISILNREAMPPGEHTFTWDGSGVAPGIYVIRAITDEASMARSVTITR